MIFDGSQVNLLIAFIGGLVTFFASCLLPLVPVYLAYLSGITLTKKIVDGKEKVFKREVFINSVLFVAGFIIVFVLLGVLASFAGRIVNIYKPIVQKIGGIFFIILGLFMLDVIRPAALLKERKLNLNQIVKARKLNSFLVGSTFGFAWTPCIGPVLAVILFWASQQATFWQGLGLLLAYGIGLGIPFLVVGLLFETLAPRLSGAGRLGKTLRIIAAILIIITGVLLILNRVEYLTIRLLDFFNLRTLAT